MKHTIITILIFLISSSVYAQPKGSYYLTEDLTVATKKTAVYTGKGQMENNRYRVDAYDVETNSLFATVYYTDPTIAIKDGPFINYYDNGKVQFTGNYAANQLTGTWVLKDTSGRTTDSTIYKNDKPVNKFNYYYHNNGTLVNWINKDSIKNTIIDLRYDSTGKLHTEIRLTGEKGTWKKFTEDGVLETPLHTSKQIEATFPGGAQGWRTLLEKNLNAEIPVENGAPSGEYRVVIKFTINKDGTISNIIPETNHGYGMEKEVIRIIKSGPKWLNAFDYGIPVIAIRRQPVIFVVSEGKRKKKRKD